MKKSLMKKIFVFGIIYLLFGTSIQYLTQRNSTLQAFKDESKNTFCQNSSDNTPDYYAVIAACSRYKNPSYNLPKKPFPPFSDETLMVFYKTLLQSKNWDKNHIILLLNENATKHKIINALQYIANIIEPTDYFLFSWSGHGSETYDTNHDEGNNDPKDTLDEIICPHDIMKVNDTWTNMITDDELDSYFSNITCAGMTLIFDCCLSGGMVNRTPSNEVIQVSVHPIDIEMLSKDFIRDIEEPKSVDVNGKNRVVLMSTLPDFLSRGIYLTGFPLTNCLATACSDSKKTDRNTDGIISTEEIFAIAKPLNFLQSSIFWTGVFIYFYFLYILYKVPNAFFNAIKSDLIEIIFVETFTKLFNKHFMANIPIMKDDYPDEFPLIQY